jgi:hypothetical protein
MTQDDDRGWRRYVFGTRLSRPSVEPTTPASAVVGTQREPHWNVTLLVPSEFVTMLDVIGCDPYFRQ